MKQGREKGCSATLTKGQSGKTHHSTSPSPIPHIYPSSLIFKELMQIWAPGGVLWLPAPVGTILLKALHEATPGREWENGNITHQ